MVYFLVSLSPTEGRLRNLVTFSNKQLERRLCVAGKNVNFYVKKSNQVAASGKFRHHHAGLIPFVWD